MSKYPYNVAIVVDRHRLYDLTNNKGANYAPHEMPMTLEEECLYRLHWYCRTVDFELLAVAPLGTSNTHGFVYTVLAKRESDEWNITPIIERFLEAERAFYK